MPTPLSVGRRARLAVLCLALVQWPLTATAEPVLTLDRAERIALAQAPTLAQMQSRAEAAIARVDYDGRLPDPQLIVGAVNVPADSFSLDREDMTMAMIGLRQAFPPGDSLALRGDRARFELSRAQALEERERRLLLRDVRRAWLDVFYVEAALSQVDAQRPLLERQLQAAEGRYRAAQDSQQTVLQARQELARLLDRRDDLIGQRGRARAALARWLGVAADKPLPTDLPVLAEPASEFIVERHPEWLAARAESDVARTEVNLARQDYKPGMMVDLSYGMRQTSPSGMERPNMITAMITLDLPVFRANRQDRRLAERQALEAGADHELDDRRRELEARYAGLRAEHDALLRRIRLFSEQIVPDARREASVTVTGFASDLSTLRQARTRALDAELDLTRLRVELARNRAEMLYLIGEPQP